jgi:hypothetical protein
MFYPSTIKQDTACELLKIVRILFGNQSQTPAGTSASASCLSLCWFLGFACYLLKYPQLWVCSSCQSPMKIVGDIWTSMELK